MPAEVRERGEAVGARRGRHRDHVREIEAGRIEGRGVVVRAAVARGGDEEDAPLQVRLDRVEERLREAAAAPAVVGRDDVDAAVLHELDVLHAIDRVGDAAAARGRQELAGHDPDRPVDADDADAVVAGGPDRPGHVGAVAVVVEWVRIVAGGVDAEAVVDLAVAVVVDPVAVAVRRVAEQVRRQVRVIPVDPRVDHRHDDAAASRRQVPRLDGVDVGVGHAATLARVVEPPHVGEAGIAGGRLMVDDPVGLRVQHGGVPLVALDRVLHGHAVRDSHHLEPFDEREVPVDARARQGVRLRALRRRRRGLEPDQDGVLGMARHRSSGLRGGDRAGKQHGPEPEEQPRQGNRAKPRWGRRHRDGFSATNVTESSTRASLIRWKGWVSAWVCMAEGSGCLVR